MTAATIKPSLRERIWLLCAKPMTPAELRAEMPEAKW